MRYEQQQKGLFTFYKEQEQFQLKLQRQKQQKIEEERRKEHIETNKKLTLTNLNTSNNYSPLKDKALSQPAHNQNTQHLKIRFNALKQIGNSVVVINNKSSEESDLISSTTRTVCYQEKSKLTGRFVQNKKMDFKQLQKYKASPLLMRPQRRKKSLFYQRRYQNNRNEEEKTITKLPTLVRVQENDNEDDLQRHASLKSKPIATSHKHYGGNLMRYMRSNVKSQLSVSQQGKSVSFIEFSKSYIRQNRGKKLDGLNEQQKRLMQVLCRYRNEII